MFVIDMPVDLAAPKRGDLLQTNLGTSRERTWLIWRVRRSKTANRYRVDAVRWWECHRAFRLLLFRSAEKNGGQRVIFFQRYRSKKRKLSFEEFMRRDLPDAQLFASAKRGGDWVVRPERKAPVVDRGFICGGGF